MKPCVFAIVGLLFYNLILSVGAQESYLLPSEDERIHRAEEAFIQEGVDPPTLEKPLVIGKLRKNLSALSGEDAAAVRAHLTPLPSFWALFFAVNLSGIYSGSPFRNTFITPSIYDGIIEPTSSDSKPELKPFVPGSRAYYDTEAFNFALTQPDMLRIRALLSYGPVSLDIQPELRPASNWYRLGNYWNLNYAVLSNPSRLDINIPYRGIASLWYDAVEVRVGRDKVHIGPGREQSLSFNKNIPWADHANIRIDFGPVYFSWYFIRLNPILSDDERYYMDAVYKYPELRPDKGTDFFELIQRAPEKALAISRFTFTFLPWLTFAFTQHNLIGGRSLQLSDFNPLIVFHNLFQDGVYSVPIMLDLSLTPLAGLRLYAQYLLYDISAGDETGSGTSNSAASGYQGGATYIFKPFSNSTLRLDLEFTLTDPWLYGKAYSYRQFTSRFVFVEPYNGRNWVDYPIGPDFGPDAWNLDFRALFLHTLGFQLALHPRFLERGSIELAGYGQGSDYTKQKDFLRKGLVLVKEGQEPERRLTIGLEGKGVLKLGSLGKPSNNPNDAPWPMYLTLSLTVDVVWLWNYNFIAGSNKFWVNANLTAGFSLDSL